ncbi:MAG: hypothetical protein ACI9OS_002213, partial [Ulvibacter sp.]
MELSNNYPLEPTFGVFFTVKVKYKMSKRVNSFYSLTIQ